MAGTPPKKEGAAPPGVPYRAGPGFSGKAGGKAPEREYPLWTLPFLISRSLPLARKRTNSLFLQGMGTLGGNGDFVETSCVKLCLAGFFIGLRPLF